MVSACFVSQNKEAGKRKTHLENGEQVMVGWIERQLRKALLKVGHDCDMSMSWCCSAYLSGTGSGVCCFGPAVGRCNHCECCPSSKAVIREMRFDVVIAPASLWDPMEFPTATDIRCDRIASITPAFVVAHSGVDSDTLGSKGERKRNLSFVRCVSTVVVVE